jgi:hypothetical protein
MLLAPLPQHCGSPTETTSNAKGVAFSLASRGLESCSEPQQQQQQHSSSNSNSSSSSVTLVVHGTYVMAGYSVSTTSDARMQSVVATISRLLFSRVGTRTTVLHFGIKVFGIVHPVVQIIIIVGCILLSIAPGRIAHGSLAYIALWPRLPVRGIYPLYGSPACLWFVCVLRFPTPSGGSSALSSLYFVESAAATPPNRCMHYWDACRGNWAYIFEISTPGFLNRGIPLLVLHSHPYTNFHNGHLHSWTDVE